MRALVLGRGRLARGPFWLWVGAAVMAAFAGSVATTLLFALAAARLDLGGASLALPVASVVRLVLFAACFAILWTAAVRRLHDRDLSGWWLVLYLTIPLVPLVSGDLARFTELRPSQRGLDLLGFASAAFYLVALLDLGLRRGTPGPNRFGPDPSGKAADPSVFD